MTQVYVEFLKSVLDTINFSYEKEQYDAVGATEQYNALFAEKEALVKGNYQWIKSNGLVDGLLEFLKNEYGDDTEVYLVLLDYVFSIVQDTVFEVEYMKIKFEDGMMNDGDLFTLLNLDMQIRAFSWQDNLHSDFERQWTINEILGERLRKAVGFYCDRIPVEERDENTVVVLTSQILKIKHAPTKLVFDTCYRLKKYLGKNVVIINIAQYTDILKMQQCGIACVNAFNVCEEYNGVHEVPYKDVEFPMCQVVLNEDNLREVAAVLGYVYEIKPMCIWNVATLPAVLGLSNQITTNIYTDCTEGYAPVKTDIFYNYFANSNENSKKNRSYLENMGTDIVDSVFISERTEVQFSLNREEFDIPDEAFVICVAGNRLLNELDDVYLNIMDTVMDENSKVHLMLIGKVTAEFVEENTKKMKNSSRIHFVGFRPDFLECMALTDLYVNTFGVGGGTAGNNSMFLGKPIVTLNKGDIYSFVGDEFAVETVEEYIPLINRYIQDKDFYKKQSELARERYEKLSANEEKIASVLSDVLDKVR